LTFYKLHTKKLYWQAPTNAKKELGLNGTCSELETFKSTVLKYGKEFEKQNYYN
jgi:hypothetical protein